MVEADALSPELGALMLHRMVFGFPDRELMLSIPMPAPRGEEQCACHFVWFRPVAESALAGLCRPRHRLRLRLRFSRLRQPHREQSG